jgi:hypothetical protein
MMGNTVKFRVPIMHDGKYSQISCSYDAWSEIVKFRVPMMHDGKYCIKYIESSFFFVPVEGTYNFSSNKSCTCFDMANVGLWLGIRCLTPLSTVFQLYIAVVYTIYVFRFTYVYVITALHHLSSSVRFSPVQFSWYSFILLDFL